MGTFTNGEDPDEMSQSAAFPLGLHCLLRPEDQNRLSDKVKQYF